jgi:hypothetical protein
MRGWAGRWIPTGARRSVHVSVESRDVVSEYLKDMQAVREEIFRVLRSGALCALVIGESKKFPGTVEKVLADSQNRIKADLAQLIMNNAARAGFMKLDKNGNPGASGLDGIDGYLLWCAVNEPRAYMALLARILPYYVNTLDPVGSKEIMSYEEAAAELRERGLPPDLINHLRLAPEILDPGEDPDPYGLMKTVPPDTEKK